MPARFRKEERLKSRKVIQALFNRQGDSFGQHPLRLVWMPMDERRSTYPVQFGLSVPKKQFRKAVERNGLRRRIREAYRLHKHRLYQQLSGQEKQYAFMVLYTGREKLDYPEIEKAMQQLMHRFVKKVRQNRQSTNRR